ncbi:hypothetical protein DLM_4518 [Aquitalea magnusonii]|uniref:Uncharacterized protein n=1 Tax=Aquitalea magnusonii TaxID=332411 RepID=A0A3G9GZF8_9NEIS|nr:hypothetical protein DLM_4518 [Aquitalea magnusonii]
MNAGEPRAFSAAFFSVNQSPLGRIRRFPAWFDSNQVFSKKLHLHQKVKHLLQDMHTMKKGLLRKQ